MEDFLEWPLIIIISTLFLSYLIYVVYLWRKDDKELKELQKNAKCDPIDDIMIDFTLEELHKYDGVKNPKIYIGCKNKVFDVTSSFFYSPEGAYHHFAGNECSVAFAKFNEESKYFNCYNDKMEFTLSERDNLEDWYQKLSFKYKMVGKVVYN